MKRLPPGKARALLAVFLLLLPLAAGAARAETGVVEEVVDGDTLRVRVAGEVVTVRLIGIDAPERSHPSLGKEFFADESAAHLSSVCLGKTVRMEADAEGSDKYDRLLRYVFLPSPDGRLLNFEMLRTGFARAYTRFPFSRKDDFVAAEGLARREGNGLWRDGGAAEARWLASGNGLPVQVYPSGGRRYAIGYKGWLRGGLERGELPKEIEWIVRNRAELSEAEFARKAGDRGYRPADPAKDAPEARTREAASPGGGDPVVRWEEAHRHAGEEIVVEGTIVRSHRLAKVLYLNFHPNWKRYLTVVIFASDLPRFPADPEKAYKGRKVRVRGEVRIHQGRPEITVRSPEDIAVAP